ncbi:MAG: hypothetical protein ACTSUC_04635, partial [Promethearchaeota archaeon]
PLPYKNNDLSAQADKTMAYLKFTLPAEELLKSIISDNPDSEREIFITDSEDKIIAHNIYNKIGTIFNANTPDLTNYIIFQKPFLNNLLHLYFLVSKFETQKIASVAHSLYSSIDKHISTASFLSAEIKTKITNFKNIWGSVLFMMMLMAVALITFATWKISTSISHLGLGNK